MLHRDCNKTFRRSEKCVLCLGRTSNYTHLSAGLVISFMGGGKGIILGDEPELMLPRRTFSLELYEIKGECEPLESGWSDLIIFLNKTSYSSVTMASILRYLSGDQPMRLSHALGGIPFRCQKKYRIRPERLLFKPPYQVWRQLSFGASKRGILRRGPQGSA